MDGERLIRRKDTTKGPPLRILSLDGGGVRGYSMLIILQELMHRTFVEMEGRAPRRHEIPKPCDHFDLIIGTGTGGLIALMLGRLRLSIETCKDVYVRMTKRVFETDKTIAGIPYRSTLFKASKLEEAIRECVREHTVYENEGNDGDDAPDFSQSTISMVPGSAYGPRQMNRSMSVASRYSQIGNSSVADFRTQQVGQSRWGNPNALLYDNRENRTKTAVTAVYKGSKKGSPPALLRSYDSRKETAAEEKCTVWQAGRATCATALAFKPIQVGQSFFLDEGNGKYNPAPIALDEALINEWPGREIGVFVSIGTGKRPGGTVNQHLWWEGFISNSMGEFAEARRRLIAKIEGCEETHQEMIKGRLAEKGVNLENYYRLNVEVGVGEFGMNEWNRLAEISTNTRMYLQQAGVQVMNVNTATKLARIWRHNQRWNKAIESGQTLPDPKYPRNSWEYDSSINGEPEPPTVPGAIELPAEDVFPSLSHNSTSHLKLPVSHSEYSVVTTPPRPQSMEGKRTSDEDKFIVHAPEPSTYSQSQTRLSMEGNRPLAPRRSHEAPMISLTPPPRHNFVPPPPSQPHQQQGSGAPPPIPPKTPLNAPARPVTYPSTSSITPPRVPVQGKQPSPSGPGVQYNPGGMQATLTRPPVGVMLPYPSDDGPPPIVNTARKPEFGGMR